MFEKNVQHWLNSKIDNETKNKIIELQKHNSAELYEAFYQNLEFGTSGLRGIMGIGTNRINKYTVALATQGFCNYLRKYFTNQEIKVVIGHDSRNNSRFLAETTAKIFAANFIKVYLFEDLRPTPEISFAIRELKCQGGVICTASHNPKEYNGYKAYFSSGEGLVPPHDKNVMLEIEKIKSFEEIKWEGNKDLIELIGHEMDDKFIKMVENQLVFPEEIIAQNDLKIVYTPIHGSGIKLIPATLKHIGFTNVFTVPEQALPDGNFPTVIFPNPEEKETMSLGLKYAKELNADILCGTDPDADRVGVGVKNLDGNWVLLNGNQTAVLILSYLIEARKLKGIATHKDFVVKTIVTTDMIDELAKKNQIHCYNVLTGFKWIADKINELEGIEKFIAGGEESFGLMIGDKLRDKDSVTAVAVLCEMCAFYKNKGLTLFQKLIKLYQDYGFYLEELITLTKKGASGLNEIKDLMCKYRNNPPKTLGSDKIIRFIDYQNQTDTDLLTGQTQTIKLPKSDVLQFITDKSTKLSIRPSGTEPKIKFYISVYENLDNNDSFIRVKSSLEEKIKFIIKELHLS